MKIKRPRINLRRTVAKIKIKQRNAKEERLAKQERTLALRENKLKKQHAEAERRAKVAKVKEAEAAKRRAKMAKAYGVAKKANKKGLRIGDKIYKWASKSKF